MWYRIELNKDRSVRTCVEVECSLNEGRSVHYVEADSKAAAIAILAARYEELLRRHRRAGKKYADRKLSEGACLGCGGERGGTHSRTLCIACLAKARERGAKRRRGEGARVLRKHATPEEKAAVFAEAQEKARVRASKGYYIRKRNDFSEALQMLDRDPVALRAWLVAKIAECQDKINGARAVQPVAAE